MSRIQEITVSDMQSASREERKILYDLLRATEEPEEKNPEVKPEPEVNPLDMTNKSDAEKMEVARKLMGYTE